MEVRDHTSQEGRDWVSRKHNTKHPERGKSSYSRRGKAKRADRYGTFKAGERLTADRLNVAEEEEEKAA